MTAIITVQDKINNAKNFINNISSANTYLAYGRATTWEPTIETPTANDTVIPLAVDSILAKKQLRQNLLSLKKIDASNVILGIRRINYTPSTVYSQYSSYDNDLFNKDFYVYTTDKNVYKCLYNNQGALSTDMPTGTSSIIVTSDGYIWRYMLTLNISDENNFLTTNYIPVRNTSQSPINGQIYTIDVGAVGTGYSFANVAVNGNGSGCSAIANLSSGSVTSITVTSYGSGYDFAEVVITGDGNGCEAIANISPEGGHGSDLQDELGAFYAIIAPKVSYDESSKFLVNNDFRQISIIQGITVYNSATEYTASAADATVKVILANSSSYSDDSLITLYDNSVEVGTAIIVRNDIPNNTLYLSNILTPTITNTFSLSDGVTTSSVVSVDYPDVDNYSGKILFYINREPVNRNSLQSETYRFIFDFE